MKPVIGMSLAMMLAACSGGESGDAESTPVALVALAPARQGALDETVTLYGTVENGAAGKRVLAAPVEGTVMAIDAPVGTHVRAGQVIARLAPSPTARLDLAKAASDAVTAQAAYARAQRLLADGLVSNAEVETARNAAQTAGATRTSLAARGGGLVLRAPAAGYVETLAFAPGDIVPAGSAVATLAATGNLRARFGVDPALAGRVRAGAALKIARSGGADFDATVQSVDPVVDPATRLAAIFAMVPAAAGISANSTISAHLTLGDAAGGAALTVPYAALLDDGGQPYVFAVSGGVAHRHDVETGATSGDRIVIVKGVKPGEQVVTEGGTALEDGMKVRTK